MLRNMDYEKNDKLSDVSIVIDEGVKPYYSDVFSPGETKEQLRVGKEVKGETETVVDKKYCFVNNSSTQSISDSTETVVNASTFETNDSGMSGTANRIIITAAGQYLVTCQVQFAGNSTGVRQLLLLKNGSRVTYNYSSPNASSIGVIVTTIVTLAVNDYLQMAVYQTSTGSLNVNSSEGVTYLRVHQL